MKKVIYNWTLSIVLVFMTINFTNAQTPVFHNPVSPYFVNPYIITTQFSSDIFHMTIDSAMHNFNPYGHGDLNTMVKTYTYNDANNPGWSTVNGPIIGLTYGDQMQWTITNNLDVSTNVHFSEMEISNQNNGGIHQEIAAGATWNTTFEIKDKSAVIPIKPFGSDSYYAQKQKGLSCLAIIRDEDGLHPQLSAIESALPGFYGFNDLPIILETKQFLKNITTDEITINTTTPYIDEYQFIVNGTVDPYLQVVKNVQRLRLINNDSKFTMNIGVGNRSFTPLGMEIIATDRGYLTQSANINEVLLAPGERVDVLLDLRNHVIGDSLFIYNKVSDIPSNVVGSVTSTITTDYPNGFAQNRVLIKLVVGNNLEPISTLTFPMTLLTSEQPSINSVINTKTKIVTESNGILVINNTPFAANVINDAIGVNETQTWEIKNQTTKAFTWFMEGKPFYVTEIKDASGNTISPSILPSVFDGAKDKILVQAGWTVTYIKTFSDYLTDFIPDNSYAYGVYETENAYANATGQFAFIQFPVATNKVEIKEIEAFAFPNPTDGMVNLKITNINEPTIQVDLINSVGKILNSYELNTQNSQIDLSDYSIGTYFIRIKIADKYKVLKVLKI